MNRTTENNSLPYSLDLELSRQRHADPEYVNSSDPIFDICSSPSGYPFIPSSPHRSDDRMDIEEDEDEMTDDDEAPDSLLSQESLRTMASSKNTFTGRSSTFTGHCGSILGSPAIMTADRKESSWSTPKKPATAVAAIFDSSHQSDLILEGMQLHAVPHELKDLVDLEDLGNRLLKINLSNNFISELNWCIYLSPKLIYLSLRGNELQELSPLIGKIKYLRELQLGQNKLTALPVELLQLTELRTLITYPNRFLPKPELTNETLRIYEPVESLKELCYRSIMKELKKVKNNTERERLVKTLVAEHGEDLKPALNAFEAGKMCSICRGPMIKPVAVHLRWTEHPSAIGAETLPYQTSMCSRKCLNQGRRVFSQAAQI